MSALAIADICPGESRPQIADPRNFQLEQLLARIERRDRDAFKQLYDVTSKPIFTTILAMVRSREIAEEVTQDTFVTIWQRAGQFDPSRGRPLAWLMTIARNRAIDRLRRERTKLQEAVSVDECQELEDEAFAGRKFSIEALAMRQALAELKPDYRQAILLAYFRGCSHGEIAAAMGVPLGTAKSYVRRGLARLQDLL